MRILIIILAFSFSLLAQKYSETLVNNYFISDQKEPAISSNGNNDYVIIWTSINNQNVSDIYCQTFAGETKVGKEFKVNSNFSSLNCKPKVAMNKDGSFYIVFTGIVNDENDYDIILNSFDKKGKRIIKDSIVNTYKKYSQSNPSICINEKGIMLITWHSWYQDGSDRGIFGKIFDTKKNKCTQEFQINTNTLYSQAKPIACSLLDGNFLVAWESFIKRDTTSDYDLYMQILNPSGEKIGNETKINSYEIDDQFYPSISLNKKGDILIAYCSWNEKGEDGEIIANLYSKNLKIKNSGLHLNTTIKGYQWLPSVILNDDGSYITTWSSWQQDGSREGIILQKFDKNNLKIGSEIILNDYHENYQWEPVIAKINKNEFVVVWSSYGQKGNDDYDIWMKKIKF